MNESELFPLLEEALRAQLATRCRRAYHHDMKNGLQGIYGGVDALIRAARTDKPVAIPFDQLVQFARHAITNHEHGLERVLANIAPDEESIHVFDVAELLGELTRFLMSDASRYSVRFRSELIQGLDARADRVRVRLAFLGLMTEAIDAMPHGGDIHLRGAVKEQWIEIGITDGRAHVGGDTDVFALDLNAHPLRKGIVLPTVRHIVSSLGGRVECIHLPQSGRETTVLLPRS
jgi:signal transduction histidine kinase